MNRKFLPIVSLIILAFLVNCSQMKKTSISIIGKPYGSIEGGGEISIYSFKNRHGVEMEVINYGAIVTTLRVPDRDGKLADVVLGFDNIEEYVKFSSKVLTPIRKMGSASLDMAYVAAGRCDGFWQRNLNYWDIGAGILLVKEAGGFVTDFEGNNNYVENKTILATNSGINEEMTKILK